MAFIQRNIEVDSEVWSKLKAKAIEKNRNVRELAGEILTDHFRDESTKKKPKAIIIAAGPGKRLGPLTSDKPKCMLKIKGKTILQRAIEIFRECGIEDIIIIRGHKKSVINYPNIKYYYNADYKSNNILMSLMTAESGMDGPFIATYSDILFKKEVVQELLKNRADISIVADTEWRSHYENRYEHPIEEAEKVAIEKGKIKKIGKVINPNEATGEFIGMIKLSDIGTEILKKQFHRVKKEYANSQFHAAATIQNAYLTDMMQELVDRGHTVTPVEIEGKWMEIDTHEDYQKACKSW